MDQHQNQPQDGVGNGQGVDNLRPQHPQRQARAIGTHDEPNIHGHRAGIRAPAVENNNFEIKSSLINMIQSNKYHGLALEDPLDHLDNFDKLCGTTKISGVSEDAFKLRLFPFSLGDKAHTWEKSLSRDSITAWDECKKAFFTKFLSTSRTAKLRNEISGFHQRNLEGFGEAWESDEHDRSNRGSGGDDTNTKRESKALQEKMDMLLLDRVKQEKVNFVGEKKQEGTVVLNEVNGLEALENQFASMSSNSKRPMVSLPGTSEQNPKETMKSITLRSGKQFPPRTLIRDNEKQGGEMVINVDDDVVIVDEKTNEEILEKIVKAKGKGKVGEEKKVVNKNEAATSSKGAPFIRPPYEAKLPFPGRFKRQLLEQYMALFEKQMSEVQITMPIIDAFMLVPQYSKFLKDVVIKKKKEMEGMVVLTHECSAIIHRLTIPKKLEDSGSFTLPCAIGQLAFEKCLCDLGASGSLMPLSIAKRFGFTQYKKCRLSLVLADRSVKIPIGILEDIPVTVGNCQIPTDFVVLEMDEEPTDPLILGRPFLATAGAIVNVKERKIDLHLGKGNILPFDIKEVMKKPTTQSQAFYIEEMEALAEEYLEELAIEDSLQHALTVD
ncbi:PREDICTED: uncharacterized protein LOC106330843 [Brassica oleracea var. oleracea]|uniref:uncharacterized protein LOC106330843 n=1 Tax=Brassica oleracea var. oleracea TaxID=109376 RepID=UPI0006A73030|nr:PREDICTED: uncharacterized protein LOC106330843 [Brassica oleracea var. oleracea]